MGEWTLMVLRLFNRLGFIQNRLSFTVYSPLTHLYSNGVLGTYISMVGKRARKKGRLGLALGDIRRWSK